MRRGRTDDSRRPFFLFKCAPFARPDWTCTAEQIHYSCFCLPACLPRPSDHSSSTLTASTQSILLLCPPSLQSHSRLNTCCLYTLHKKERGGEKRRGNKGLESRPKGWTALHSFLPRPTDFKIYRWKRKKRRYTMVGCARLTRVARCAAASPALRCSSCFPVSR